MIKDSGDRTEFETGAVRDMQKGKGRCDLLPLDVISDGIFEDDETLLHISKFVDTGEEFALICCLTGFLLKHEWDVPTMILEVSKQFEEGAEKYGENNWQKGLPVRCYINSAIRHYLKWLRGDVDEPHDRAFVWNILCGIWTCRHKPELNDYRKGDKNENN